MTSKVKKNSASKIADNSEDKIIYGDYYIIRNQDGSDSLVQYQTLVSKLTTGKIIISDNTVVLIKDIWKDLLSDNGTYKTNGKGYFYYEIKKTSIDNDDITIQEKFECPKPDEMYQDRIADGEFSGSYADYWKDKINKARENYQKESVILKNEILLKGTEYEVPNKHIKVDNITVKRSDTGISELGNLLTLF